MGQAGRHTGKGIIDGVAVARLDGSGKLRFATAADLRGGGKRQRLLRSGLAIDGRRG